MGPGFDNNTVSDENESSNEESLSESEESVYSGLEEEPDTEESQSEDESDDESDVENDAEYESMGKNISEEAVDPNSPSNLKTGVEIQAKCERLEKVTDEYEYDSSDEEDLRNTVGNIPMHWYDEYPHIGYDLSGQKILKPKTADEMDTFLQRMDNPDFWRTVKDKMTGQNVVLTPEDVQIVQNLRSRQFMSSINPYEEWTDFFTHEKMLHPVTNRPADKRSFTPSLYEKNEVSRMVHSIKMGWMKADDKKEDDNERRFYDLWTNSQPHQRLLHHIPAPKMSLPGHAESYNPPPEYLFTKEEKEQWLAKDESERRTNFVPNSFSRMRLIPMYQNFIKERFERCLDLYLCPRQKKVRMNVDPEDLLPKLPKPSELKPFPSQQSIIYKGHESLVRSISVDPTGQWLFSGSDDGTVRFWEVSTGRCMKFLKMGGVVKNVAWNPNPSLSIVAVTIDDTVYIINSLLGDKLVVSNTDLMIDSSAENETDQTDVQLEWINASDKEKAKGIRIKIKHAKKVSQVNWHSRGDYMSVVIPNAGPSSVLIHQISKRRSQKPFSKSKGLVQCTKFHPTRPFFFVATQRYVRVYNLLKQEIIKKLQSSCKWISSLAIHPAGDNCITGSYDCRSSWFDLDLSVRPYKTLRHHKRAIRQVSFHQKYPLFASASDDGTVIVCHGMVYDDLLQNPLIVPVKVLRSHQCRQNLGVLDCVFHPTQPWIFSSGADTTIRLYT